MGATLWGILRCRFRRLVRRGTRRRADVKNYRPRTAVRVMASPARRMPPGPESSHSIKLKMGQTRLCFSLEASSKILNPDSRSFLANSSARQTLKPGSVTDPVCRAFANHQSSLLITALPFEGVVKSSLVNSPKIHDPCNFVALLKKNRGKRVDFGHRKRFRIVG